MALNMQYEVVTLVFTLILQCTASDLYSDLVRKYDANTFKLNIGRGHPHFVNFFAPWCGYCKRLKPVWDELAEKYNVDGSNMKVIIAKIDCTVETPLCADQGVSGYPSLIFYNVGNTAGIKYKGKRDLATLEEFISSSIEGKLDINIHPVPAKSKNADKSSNGAVELTDQDFHNTIDWGMHFVKFYAPWCGHCQKLAPIWDDLALNSEHDPSVTISKIDCTANRLSCGEFEVKAFPTLLWIVNGKKVEKYQGQRTLVDLKRFLIDMKKAEEVTLKIEDGKIPDTTVELTPIVVQLTEANFENAVAHGLTFVKFFAPWCGHCRRLAPTWDELARKFVSNTQVTIAEVDCTLDEDLCNKHKVQGYPTLFLYRNGESIAEFNGVRDLESLYGFVQDHVGHDEL